MTSLILFFFSPWLSHARIVLYQLCIAFVLLAASLPNTDRGEMVRGFSVGWTAVVEYFLEVKNKSKIAESYQKQNFSFNHGTTGFCNSFLIILLQEANNCSWGQRTAMAQLFTCGKDKFWTGSMKKWCKPLCSAQTLTQSLWGARPRAERDETITSAEVGFLASLSSERQAQKRQETITIFSNWQELDSNGRLKGKKDLWALTFSIWKLFVKSGRGRKGQRTAVLRIWKFHPGSISSTKPRPQWTRVHTLNLPGSFYGACPQLAFLQLLCNWYHPKRKLSKPASHCLTKMPAFKYPSEEPLSLIIQLSSDQR